VTSAERPRTPSPLPTARSLTTVTPAVFFASAATCLACLRPPAANDDAARRPAPNLKACVSPQSLEKLKASWRSGAGMRAEVRFKNEMSDAFQLTDVTVIIDERILHIQQEPSSALAKQRDIRVNAGFLPVGDHAVCVEFDYQGNRYGAHEDLRGYRFVVESSHRVAVASGTALTLTVIARERGGPETPLERRPVVDWHEGMEPVSDGKPGGRE
jgi:hypothetical protein